MSQISKIVVLGGDNRQYYMVEQLHQLGFPVAVYGLDMKDLSSVIYEANSIREAMSFGKIVICPVPFSKSCEDIFSKSTLDDLTVENLLSYLNEAHILFGGCIPSKVKEFCNEKKIPYYDLMGDECVTIANAVATAEGAILEAIKRSPLTLHQNRSLVFGYGRCAKILADKLKGLSSKVTITVRSKEALAMATAYGFETIPIADINKYLAEFPFIFNTIPSIIMDAASLSYVQKDVTIIDIASAPGGLNYEYCNQMHINASLCPALPGKYSPKTSAKILNDVLLSYLNSLISS